jgi:hypothetical protein
MARNRSVVIGGCLMALAASARGGVPGGSRLIDFEDQAPGTVISNQYIGQGVLISVQRSSEGPPVATLYDTNRTGEPDPDLQNPYELGNLAPEGTGGNILIIPENNTDRDGDGRIDVPNDEGERPAGQFTFDFIVPITTFGFDLVDVEGPAEFNENAGYVASFYLNGGLEARLGFGAFVDPESEFYDPSVRFGDNSANRIEPISARDLGMPYFDRVVLNFGGSGGTDNILYTPIPEPSSLAALGLAVPALSLRRRRR